MANLNGAEPRQNHVLFSYIFYKYILLQYYEHITTYAQLTTKYTVIIHPFIFFFLFEITEVKGMLFQTKHVAATY